MSYDLRFAKIHPFCECGHSEGEHEEIRAHDYGEECFYPCNQCKCPDFSYSREISEGKYEEAMERKYEERKQK